MTATYAEQGFVPGTAPSALRRVAHNNPMRSVRFSGKTTEAQTGGWIPPLAATAEVSAYLRMQGVWEGCQQLSWSGWGPTEAIIEALPCPSLQSPHWPAQCSFQLKGALRKENLAFLSPGGKECCSRQDKWLF